MPRRIALIITALVVTFFLPPAAEASPWIGVWIEDRPSDTCVATPDGSPGALITHDPCVDIGNQLWNFEDVAKFTVRIRSSMGTGMCLAATSPTGGSQVLQAPCGGGSSDVWTLTGSGNTFRISNTNGGGCLARTGGSAVVLGSCMPAFAEWQLLF
jgi:hypothetical protein